MRYSFEDFEIDMQLYELRRNGQPCKLEPQEFNVLAYLIEHRNEIVTKEELLEHVWPDQFVSEATLSQRIMTVRKALGESGRTPRCIKTIHGRGYRFISEIRVETPKLGPDVIDDACLAATQATPTLTAPTDNLSPVAEATSPQTSSTRANNLPIAERRQLTILFCDLVGSTALSEQIDPEDLDEILQSYYEACDEAIKSFDGHVAQYLGDGLLIYFGYPYAQEDAARRAVYAGLAVLQAMSTLNHHLETHHGIRLAVRIGIHTGLVVVGEGRPGGRAEQLAVGATPNLASRIQSLSTPDTVSISEATYSLIQGYFELDEMGLHELPGVLEPMALYRVTAVSGSQHRLDVQPAKRLTPFVGREMERLVFQEHWEEVKRGQGRLILLSGEAGIGKSRLARAVLTTVSEEPHLLLEGHCSPYHQHTAFYPLVDLLRKHLQWDVQGSATNQLEPVEQLDQLVRQCGLNTAQSVPLLASLLGLQLSQGRYPALAFSPQQHRQHTLELLLNLVVQLSMQQPLVLFLEDVHWLDPSTFDWLELLVSQGPTASILTLLTSRPDFQSPWAGRAHVKTLSLNRLPQPQIAQIIQSIAASGDVSADFINQITLTTDGVPLFVEEVTRWIVESASRGANSENEVLPLMTGDMQIPATLQDLLTARLDSVGDAKRTAQVGATIGREFAYRLLRGVSSLEERPLQDDLDVLVAADLLYRRGVGPEATYQFKHVLIQDAAYQSLLRRTRQQLHAQLAQLLENRFPDIVETQPELVAHHYTEAGHIEQALVYWQRAGRYANARSAHIEAIAHLKNGLKLLENLSMGSERDQQELSLLSALGPVLMALKGYGNTEVEQTYRRARKLCQQLDDPVKVFPVLYGLYELYEYRGAFQTSREVGEELLSVALRQSDTTLLLGAHEALACTGFHLGTFEQVLNHTQESFSIYKRQQHGDLVSLYGRNVAVSSHYWAAMSLWFQGYIDQAWARNREALDLAQEFAHPYSVSMTFIRAAFLGQFCRMPSATYQWAESAMTIALEHGFLTHVAIATILQGWTLTVQKQGDEGTLRLHQGLDAYQQSGGEMDRPYFLALLAESYHLEGQAEKGLSALDEAFEALRRGRDFFYEAELYRLQGMLLSTLSADHAQQTEGLYHQALDVARRQHAKSIELRASISLSQLWQSQGRRQDAVELLSPLYHSFTEGLDSSDLREAKALLTKLER